MFKKFYEELITIRKELQVIRNNLKLNNVSNRNRYEKECTIHKVKSMEDIKQDIHFFLLLSFRLALYL